MLLETFVFIFIKYFLDKDLDDMRDAYEKARQTCTHQREELSVLEEQKLKEYKEKIQLKNSLEEMTKKYEFAAENYKELQAMVLRPRKKSSAEVSKEQQNIEEDSIEKNNEMGAENLESKFLAELTLKEQEISRLRFENTVSSSLSQII